MPLAALVSLEVMCKAYVSIWGFLQEYVDLLIEEINASVPVGLAPLKTLYFGGGTPSLIPPQQLERLIRALDRRFGITAGAEVSMEADPGTFDAERLRQYMGLGLTRFSVGVQAFQEVGPLASVSSSALPPVLSPSLSTIFHPSHLTALSMLLNGCTGACASRAGYLWLFQSLHACSDNEVEVLATVLVQLCEQSDSLYNMCRP